MNRALTPDPSATPAQTRCRTSHNLHAVRQTPIYGVLAAFILSSPLLRDGQTPDWIFFMPFFASGLVLGLPHGALDDRIVARLLPPPGRPNLQKYAIAYSGYLTAALGYLAIWWIEPVYAFGFFLALTWFHWGQGDLHFLRHGIQASYLNTPLMRGLAIFLRGALPMAVTWLAHPSVYARVFEATVAIIPDAANRGFPDLTAFATGPTADLLLILILFAAGVYATGGVLISKRRSHWTPLAIDCVELILLTALFLSLNPILSIGLYFCLWHSLRHLIRLDDFLDEGNTRAVSQSTFPGWFRFRLLIDAMPNTLISLLGLALIVPLFQLNLDNLYTALGVYLILIAILTLPHVGVVIWMDLLESRKNQGDSQLMKYSARRD